MTSREKFEAFLVSEYEWGNDALNAANFHGDDATGYYTGGDFIYDGQSCSECLFWAWRGWQAAELASEQKPTDTAVQLANAESKCRELAAESDKTSERMQQLIQIINNADNDYCICGDAMKNHTHGGCGHPTGMFDYHYNQWLQAENKTSSTDAFLAEVRAQAHKEGAHFVANRMLAAWEAGFIEDTAKNAADIARMILTSTEFMPNAPQGDFDRSFADGVLEDIAAQLRQEAAQ